MPAMCPATPPTTAPLMQPLACTAPLEASAIAAAQTNVGIHLMISLPVACLETNRCADRPFQSAVGGLIPGAAPSAMLHSASSHARNPRRAEPLSVMDRRTRLLGQAEQARRIAQSINDAETSEALRKLADDYEQQAKSLESDGRDQAEKKE